MSVKSYLKWSLNFTTSKLLSYLIFIVSSALAFYIEDAAVSKEIFVTGLMWAAILQGTKAVSEKIGGKNA